MSPMTSIPVSTARACSGVSEPPSLSLMSLARAYSSLLSRTAFLAT
jgi:hypothetical protein